MSRKNGGRCLKRPELKQPEVKRLELKRWETQDGRNRSGPRYSRRLFELNGPNEMKSLIMFGQLSVPIVIYDNEYTKIIDIYYYEFFQPSQTSSACAPKHLRHPV